MNFIKKIFENKADEDVHKQFKRYGKGIYQNKAIIEIANSKNNVKIKTSFEFAHDFIEILTPTINGKTRVTGSIITTQDIRNALGFEIADMSQFAGVRNLKIDTDLSKEDILNAISENPNALFLLSFSTDYGSLKTKPKSPTSSKPEKSGETEIKADFCIFSTSDKKILDNFAFDVKQDFKKLKIKHDFIIDEVIIEDAYKNDYKLIREKGKRKGKIIRYLDIDGKKEEHEHSLEA